MKPSADNIMHAMMHKTILDNDCSSLCSVEVEQHDFSVFPLSFFYMTCKDTDSLSSVVI